MRTSNIRFTGLASGLDTESIVKSMIAPYQSKVDFAKQDKALMELKKESWKEINTKIYDFYRKALSDIKFSNSYGKAEVAISNSSVIMVDKNTSIPEGNHTIDVTQIAKGATISTSQIKQDKDGNSIDAKKETPLTDLGIIEGDIITVTVNGEERTLEVGANTSIGDVEKLLQYRNKKDSYGNVIYETDGKPEQELDPNVNAKFDISLGAFIINTKNTGADQTITFKVENSGGTDETVDRLSNIGILVSEFKDKDGNVINGIYGYRGQNAKFTYNGGITLETESNKININGLRATIIGESQGNSVSISAVKDTQSTINFVKDFVSEYNKLLEEMNTLVDAPSNRKYRPLTEEQKQAMSENDIKLWEKRVKDSILRNDSVLKDLARDMRSIMGDSNLYEFGINTGANWQEKGKLHIDEEKLKEMLEKDPNRLDEVLKKAGTAIYDKLSERLLKGTDVKSASFLFNDKLLKDQIDSIDKKILTLEDRLSAQENLYYKKFTAMEKMLSRLNQQGNWLAGQLGGN